MKSINLFLIFTLLSCNFIFAQNDTSSHCKQEKHYYKKGNIEGMRFSEYTIIFRSTPEYTKLPKLKDVLTADSLAYLFLNKKNIKWLWNFNDRCPNVIKNWNNYFRQSICFMEKSKKDKYEEIIRIQYLWKGDESYKKHYKDFFMSIDGGCTEVFSVYYNVRKKKILDYIIN